MQNYDSFWETVALPNFLWLNNKIQISVALHKLVETVCLEVFFYHKLLESAKQKSVFWVKTVFLESKEAMEVGGWDSIVHVGSTAPFFNSAYSFFKFSDLAISSISSLLSQKFRTFVVNSHFHWAISCLLLALYSALELKTF